MENFKKIQELTDTLIRVEENLKEEYKILTFLLECSLDGYWDWHIETNYEYLSPKFKQQLGYEKHEMENKPESWQNLCDPADLSVCYKLVTECISGEKEEFETVMKFKHKQGHEINILCKGIVISRNKKGVALRMVGTHKIVN